MRKYDLEHRVRLHRKKVAILERNGGRSIGPVITLALDPIDLSALHMALNIADLSMSFVRETSRLRPHEKARLTVAERGIVGLRAKIEEAARLAQDKGGEQ